MLAETARSFSLNLHDKESSVLQKFLQHNQQARIEMTFGTAPASESVQALARRWLELIEEFTDGDPGIEQSLNQMYQQEGTEVASRGAVDAALMDYMGRAMQC